MRIFVKKVNDTLFNFKHDMTSKAKYFIEDETGNGTIAGLLVTAIVILGIIGIQSAVNTWFGNTNTTILNWLTNKIATVMS